MSDQADPLARLKQFLTPADVAIQLGVSVRRVKADARRLGRCIIVGNRMLLSPEDVSALLAEWRPKPQASVVRYPGGSGGYAKLVRSRGNSSQELKELLERRKTERRAKGRSSKKTGGT